MSMDEYELRRRSMADSAGKQTLSAILAALQGRGFAAHYRNVGAPPMAQVLGVPAFRLHADLDGDDYNLTLETPFGIAGGALPKTIVFGAHQIHLTVQRKADGVTREEIFVPNFRQVGDDVTMLIPPAAVTGAVDAAIAAMPPSTTST